MITVLNTRYGNFTLHRGFCAQCQTPIVDAYAHGGVEVLGSTVQVEFCSAICTMAFGLRWSGAVAEGPQ